MSQVLSKLRPAFQYMRLTPTFAAHRTPVYIFLGVWSGRDSTSGAAALAFVTDTPTTGDGAFIKYEFGLG